MNKVTTMAAGFIRPISCPRNQGVKIAPALPQAQNRPVIFPDKFIVFPAKAKVVGKIEAIDKPSPKVPKPNASKEACQYKITPRLIRAPIKHALTMAVCLKRTLIGIAIKRPKVMEK